MIKIRIQNEEQFKKDFLDRIKPLVTERFNFYLKFAKWQDTITSENFLTFMDVKVTGKQKTTLLNILLKENLLKSQNQIEDFNFKDNFKYENYHQFILETLPNILNNLDNILVDKLNDLIDLNKKIYIPRSKLKLKNLLLHIFDYEDFNGGNENWNYSHEFTYKLNLNVCPYCNRNFITTVLDDHGKIIGPSIDHYLSQKEYPLLRISLYNLIPSCTVCNSNLKHSKEFDLINYLYPYDDEYGDQVYFDFNIIERNGLSKDYEILVLPNPHTDSKLNQKLRGPEGNTNMKIGSVNIFQIEKIYTEAHSDLIKELVNKCDENNPYYAKSVINFFGDADLEDFYKYYFGNYLNKEDWNKRPLSKLTFDIVSRRLKEFGVKSIEAI